jgi:hypothetical protein
MFYAQAVCGMSPTQAALLTAPMAIMTGVLAPFVGRLVDRAHPRPIVGFGFSALAIALTWLSIEMTPTTPIWRLMLPFVLMGVGMAFIWSPLAATATRNLPPHLAGAGSGVYNTTRQVGSVLGSAAMAALMTSQISTAIPAELDPGVGQGAVTRLPAFLHAPFSAALSQSLLLPAFVALVGVVAALFLRGFQRGFGGASSADRGSTATGRVLDARRHVEPDYFLDDDDYVEYTVDWSAEAEDAEGDEPVLARDGIAADESVTVPLSVHVEHPLHAPADTWHGGPVQTWHSLMTHESAAARDGVEHVPNGYVHNGFHTESADRLRVAPLVTPGRGRHSRVEDREDDAGGYGGHSVRG